MSQLDFEKKTMPLYAQIKKIIKERIEKNIYAPGEIIPSEAKFQEEFGVSRITVRQAICQLEKEGLVERTRGKGTRVVYKNKIIEDLMRVQTFTNEMEKRGITPGTRYGHIIFDYVDNDIAKIFSRKPDEKFFQLFRVRTGNDVPLVYSISYFLENQELPLDDKYYQENLYTLLEDFHVNVPIRTEEYFYAMNASKEVAEKLDMEKGEAVLVRRRIFYDISDRVVSYMIAYYPGDRYQYKVKLTD